MLAPILTKDMRLFPSRPIPAHVKNVRTRAQSLNDFADSNTRSKQSQQKAKPIKQHALSTGNLNHPPNARSPPKGSIIEKKKPLDSIAEGVELASNPSSATLKSALPPVPSSSKLKKDANGNSQPATDEYGKLIRCPAINLAAVKHSPDQELCSLQELSSRPCSSMSTISEPSSQNVKPEVTKSKTSSIGLVKMFTAAFKSRPKANASRCNQEAHKKTSNSSNKAPAVP